MPLRKCQPQTSLPLCHPSRPHAPTQTPQCTHADAALRSCSAPGCGGTVLQYARRAGRERGGAAAGAFGATTAKQCSDRYHPLTSSHACLAGACLCLRVQTHMHKPHSRRPYTQCAPAARQTTHLARLGARLARQHAVRSRMQPSVTAGLVACLAAAWHPGREAGRASHALVDAGRRGIGARKGDAAGSMHTAAD